MNHNLRVRAAAVGLGVVALAAGLYWLSARDIHSDRRDFYYLADAFLHGRTWLTEAPFPFDVIGGGDGRWYLPFAPFPAIAFMPLVALIGPVAADHLEPGIHAALAAGSVGLCWMLLGRIGVADLVHRFWVVALFGFSTVIWWVTARGGVWHTGQLIATVLTFGCLVELFGRPRVAVIGLMAGAAFLTRAPLALAVPFYMLLLPGASVGDTARRYGGVLTGTPVRQWLGLGLGTLPAIAFFFWYDAVRFGDPRESGYALASVIGFLDERRDLGLFSTAHLGMNLELLFLRLPVTTPDFPYIKPDGFGMSVLFTSPGLLLAIRAPWRSPKPWVLFGAAIAVLVPTLLYYGGGWVQFGYRYFLDSIPFVIALVGLGVARHGLGWPSIALILFGVSVNAASVYWVGKI